MKSRLEKTVSEVLCVLPGPNVEARREPAGDLWCFGDRARLPHDWVLLEDAPDSPAYGWYDPVWVRECSHCKRDRTAFPG